MTTTVENIPVQVLNIDSMSSANKLVEVTSGDKISVKVRAKRSIAGNLTVNDFEAIADVTNKNEFDAVPIIVSCKSYSDADLDILSHATEDGSTMMHLSLADLSSRSFGVAVITEGKVREGYYIVNNSVSPNLITIRGTEKQLAKIARVAVIISVDGASGTMLQNCPVQAQDADGNVVMSDNLEFSETQVRISLDIMPSKEVEVVINSTGTVTEGFYLDKFEYAPHYITIAGTADNLSKVDRIVLGCNISDATEDVETMLDIEAAVRDLYGDNITIVNENKTISVRAVIKGMSVRTFTLPTDRIEIRNCAEGLECDIVNESVEIRVEGLEEDIEALVSTDLKPYIDCSGLSREGSYPEIPVMVELKDGIRLLDTSVEIVITKSAGGGANGASD